MCLLDSIVISYSLISKAISQALPFWQTAVSPQGLGPLGIRCNVDGWDHEGTYTCSSGGAPAGRTLVSDGIGPHIITEITCLSLHACYFALITRPRPFKRQGGTGRSVAPEACSDLRGNNKQAPLLATSPLALVLTVSMHCIFPNFIVACNI